MRDKFEPGGERKVIFNMKSVTGVSLKPVQGDALVTNAPSFDHEEGLGGRDDAQK